MVPLQKPATIICQNLIMQFLISHIIILLNIFWFRAFEHYVCCPKAMLHQSDDSCFC